MVTGTVPIVIQGQHLANWGFGQRVNRDLDLDEVRRYALTIGVDEEALIEAARELKTIDDAAFGRIVNFAKTLSDQIGLLALQNLQQGRAISERIRAEKVRKHLEAQLQQALKMEAMGTLAGGIAHDFNNLLMAIQGRASIMLMNKASSHPDFRHLKGIEENIESAADLTRQLLGFARGGKYEIRPTDLNELIKKQNRMFGRTKKEISIRGKYEKNLWSVEVDRGQIEQVLLNLFVNALDAMPQGGDLYVGSINLTHEDMSGKPYKPKPGSYILLTVTDTGVGIDKNAMKHIFEPFFSTKGVGKGMGLGLASVYGIVKAQGGYIDVYSKNGHGTTFKVYLPASQKEVAEEKELPTEVFKLKGRRTTIDDELIISEVPSQILKKKKHSRLRDHCLDV